MGTASSGARIGVCSPFGDAGRGWGVEVLRAQYVKSCRERERRGKGSGGEVLQPLHVSAPSAVTQLRVLLQVVIAGLEGIMPRHCPELIHVERVLDERNRWCERSR